LIYSLVPIVVGSIAAAALYVAFAAGFYRETFSRASLAKNRIKY